MRKILFLIICSSLLAITAKAGKKEEITQKPQLNSIEEMLDFAQRQLRKPYRNGGEGPNSFDCSGFTRFCYKHLGISLNRTSKDQTKNGKKIRFRRNLKEGDLVFFKGSKGWKVGHVGIVISKGSGKHFQFIHASPSHGIVIENSDVKYFKKRYKKARRITSDREIRKALKRFSQQSDDPTDDVYANPQKVESAESVKTHTVSKGDTLYNISQRYGCSVADLQKWNSLKNNDISIGQKLIVSPTK